VTASGSLWCPSPNFGERRDGAHPELIVLHYTAMDSARAACDWLCNPASEVSAHYLVARDGEVVQMVADAQRAWHAGHGEWQGRADVNSRSIGIELDNAGDHPFSEPLMAALEALLDRLMERWRIPPCSVIGHSDMAPGRKIDPGRRFDWARLVRRGLAVGLGEVEPAEPDVEVFEAALRDYGMTQDADPDVRLAAFRARFRAEANGPLDGWDVALAAEASRCFGVDETPPTT